MVYKKQEGAGIWLPTVEKTELVGEVTHINREGLYGTQYTIKTKDGNEVLTPSHKVLQARMIKAKIGTVVKIVLTGTEPPKVKGQKPTTMYDVYFEE